MPCDWMGGCAWLIIALAPASPTPRAPSHPVTWHGRGGNVEGSGSFDGWQSMVPLERQGAHDEEGCASFSAELKLYPGEYEYKFIVDGNWIAGALARSYTRAHLLAMRVCGVYA